MVRVLRVFLLVTLVGAFAPSQIRTRRLVARNTPSVQEPFPKAGKLFMAEGSDDNSAFEASEPTCWNPQLRRVVGSIATLGAMETAYLTYAKLTGGSQAFCGPDGGCNSVLSGPYANIPFTDNIPLASLGLAAYGVVALLALLPLASGGDDTENRIWLTAATTTMGTFSVFLMSLLFGVLHESCPFCIVSACLSIGMAGIVWIGGGLPDGERKRGVQTSAGSFATSVLAALVLFFGADDTGMAATQFAGSPGGVTNSETLLASTEGLKPPPITESSTKRSLALASELQSLNAQMYGAYWCTHCYDQKQTLGKEAFEKIRYVECSKDGFNQQKGLCQEANVPGYPTWSLGGKLYPGEQTLEELEEIVQQAKK